MEKLQNRVALVTGAGSDGIGRAIALIFAKHGAKVVVNVGHNAKGGLESVKQIQELGGEAICIKADVSDTKQVKELIEAVVKKYGTIDILVNNHGLGPSFLSTPDLVTELKEEEWDRVIDVNLKGVFLLCKYAIPHMIRQQRGIVINISSIRGLRANPVLGVYGPSKAGLVSMSQSMAMDFAKYNIRINCICPGFTDTEMIRRDFAKMENPDEAKRFYANMNLIKRIGTTEEIANVALFFAADDSSYITGVALPVDGGYLATGIREVQGI